MIDNSLSRNEILVGMGVTAIILLVISKLILYFSGISILPIKFTLDGILWGLGLGIAITVLSSILYKYWLPYKISADFYLDTIIKPLIIIDLIWLGLLPGLSEELLFRGVLLPLIGLNWTGIIVTSIIFGLLHLSSPQHWAYIIWAGIIGVVFGYMAITTGNLLIPILAHISTNFLSSLLWKVRIMNN